MDRMIKLRREMAQKVDEAEAFVLTAESESRDMTEEELTQYEALMADAKALEQRIYRFDAVKRMKAQMDAEDDGKPKRVITDLGLGKREVEQYSLVRAIRASVESALNTGKGWDGAPLEREASQEIAKRLGREARGFFVPWEIQTRELNVGTPSAGGVTVQTDVMSLIEMLRNRMMVRTAGATTLVGLSGNLSFPRQIGGATHYWLGEGDEVTPTDQEFDNVPMAPRTVAAATEYTRKMLLQSTLDMERFIRMDLATTLALAIDRAALHGTGQNNEPTGIANTTGVGIVPIAADGDYPEWGHIIDLETEVAIDNADLGALGYMTNARVRGYLKKAYVDPQSKDGMFIWTPNQTMLNGYPAYITNQVRSDLDKGSGTELSAIFYGNWSELMIGFWGVLEILVNPYAKDLSGGIRIVAFQDTDIAVRHPQSFSAVLDAKTHEPTP